MSAEKKHGHKTTWALTGSWANAWKTCAAVGVVGLVGAGVGFAMDPKRFAFSWLFAYVTCLTVALGSLFFVLMQHLTSAGWSVTVRRTAEFFGHGIIVLIPLFIPVLMSMNSLFPWLHGHGAAEEHSSIAIERSAFAQSAPAHADPGGEPGHGVPSHGSKDPAGRLPGAKETPPADMPIGARPGTVPGREGEAGHPAGHVASVEQHGAAGDPHAIIHDEVMSKKSGYLNKGFFLARAGIYFLIWIVLAVRLFGYSTVQDKTKDPNLTVAAQRFAPVATLLYALSLTFAAFDWVMSLEPTWFSTIFGVAIFSTGVVSSLAVIILATMALRSSGPLDGAVTVEHFHDLGKLMFGFLVFWGYIQFSQFMLIWYAALPEETTFFHNRWDHAPWSTVSTAIIVFHFIVPFFWTISRNFKRNLGRLQIGAAIILVMHVVDIYWFIMPNYMLGQDGFSPSWIDLACLLGVGGVYAAFVFHRMTKFSLVPIGDPRLERSLHFQNA